MLEELNSNLTSSADDANNDGPTIIKTDVDAKDGQDKCPKCGSTDISTNANTGKLRCHFCRHEFEPEKATDMITCLLYTSPSPRDS